MPLYGRIRPKLRTTGAAVVGAARRAASREGFSALATETPAPGPSAPWWITWTRSGSRPCWAITCSRAYSRVDDDGVDAAEGASAGSGVARRARAGRGSSARSGRRGSSRRSRRGTVSHSKWTMSALRRRRGGSASMSGEVLGALAERAQPRAGGAERVAVEELVAHVARRATGRRRRRRSCWSPAAPSAPSRASAAASASS